jgi:four helix bundle protein
LIYEETKELPREEEYGIKAQIRRAAVSVPANIAEGLSRQTINDKLHFLNISQGSLSEVDTHLELCLHLKYIDQDKHSKIVSLLIEVQKMLSGLIRSLKK